MASFFSRVIPVLSRPGLGFGFRFLSRMAIRARRMPKKSYPRFILQAFRHRHGKLAECGFSDFFLCPRPSIECIFPASGFCDGDSRRFLLVWRKGIEWEGFSFTAGTAFVKPPFFFLKPRSRRTFRNASKGISMGSARRVSMWSAWKRDGRTLLLASSFRNLSDWQVFGAIIFEFGSISKYKRRFARSRPFVFRFEERVENSVDLI